jgi:hypothetical protein
VKRPSWDDFPTGVAIGLTAGFAVSALVSKPALSVYIEQIIGIVATISTLLAAGLALRGIRQQIAQSEKHADDIRERELRASAAVLPLTLGNFYRIANDCFEVTLANAETLRDPARADMLVSVSDISETDLSVLRDCIRFSDKTTAKWLQLIARKYQICRARHESMVRGTHLLLEINQTSSALDWMELRAIAEHCFEFARSEVSSVPSHMAPDSIRLHIGSSHVGSPIFAACRRLLDAKRASYGKGTPEDYF